MKLNKEALGAFMDHELTPLLMKKSGKLEEIKEVSAHEDAIEHLPFIEN